MLGAMHSTNARTEDIAEVVSDKFPDPTLRMCLTPCFPGLLAKVSASRIVSNRFEIGLGTDGTGYRLPLGRYLKGSYAWTLDRSTWPRSTALSSLRRKI